jgi:hypothetical protein
MSDETWSMKWSRPGDAWQNSTHPKVDNLSDEVTYTEVRTPEPQPDGTIEHTPARVLVDGKRPKADDRGLRDHLAGLTPAQRWANQQDYAAQAEVAKTAIPDFEAVAFQKSVELPHSAIAMLAQGGLHNSARVQYYLAQHPAVAEELCMLTDKQVQDRIRSLSVELHTDRENMELDRADYATFRKIRNRQESERYR